MLWVRAAAVLCLSVLLMGSKLIIRVPEGGEVVSSSGLVACAAGETCTVDLQQGRFAETFTAVAASGYAFKGWAGGAGAVCGGTLKADCTELDSDPFSDFETDTPTPTSGAGLTLLPAFEAREAAAVESKPRFSIDSFYTTRYYRVSGSTQEELWAQLHGVANPLAVDHKAGTKPLGRASFDYKYDYQGAYAGTASSCRVDSARLEFRFETMLPEMSVQAQAGAQLQQRWQALQDQITEHEAGHHAIYRQLVTQLPQAMTDLGAVPCSELDERVRVAVNNAAELIRQASAEYDEHHSDSAGAFVASSF
jgi:predicted secreted Zn-dependent protease